MRIMRKLIGLLIIVVLLSLSGCVQQAQPYVAPIEPPAEPPVELPTEPAPSMPPGSDSSTTPDITFPSEPPQDMTWISPGKVMIGNFFPGARAEWPLTIHNGNDGVATFAIAYRQPGYVAEGYVAAPPEVESWVIIADATPVLMPKETREVIIAVDMPEDAVSPGPQWEFWLSVGDTTQTGQIITELASRWCVQMRV